jgi:hypothetical protein
LVPLITFFILITLIFYHILSTTRSLIIFITILFAFYIIFHYVFKKIEVIYHPDDLPIVTSDDLAKYNSEAGVELRELQIGSNENLHENYSNIDDEDDDDE